MWKTIKILEVSVVVFLGTIFMFGSTLFAGIPEPGIIFYGKVRDDNGSLITNGELTWTFTPQSGGDSIIVTTELGEFNGPGGPYSYAVMVPVETSVPGFPVSDNTIPLSITSETYTMTAQITLQDISLTDAMDISVEDRGAVNKIYIMSELLDTDGDNIPDIWEQRIITADPNDDIYNAEDVFPEDDFDGDGFCNLREYLSGSDPVYDLDIPICWSDVYLDGDVDGEDAAIIAEEFYYNEFPATFDLDGDGDLDEWDMLFFCEDFGRLDCNN
jgi:hypothetical protein